jgi:hypothetical protein
MLTFKRASEVFSYDPETGIVTWKERASRRVWIGEEAGCMNSYGYRRIRLEGVHCMTHRLAWLLTYRKWPASQLDHINGDRLDNRIDNLREATPAENQQNLKRRKNNTSGYVGVRKSLNKWQAIIAIDRKRIHLGNFDTIEEAAAAYAAAKAELHTFQPVARAA